MNKITPPDLIPLNIAGELTKKGAYFFLVAATNGEIVIYRPASHKYHECSVRQISDFLDKDLQDVKRMDSIYAPSKIHGPIESIESLYLSKSKAMALVGAKTKSDPRSEQTDLLIIGAILGLIKEKTDLSTNEKVIEAVENWLPNTRGLKPRTLEDRFAKAMRAINSLD